MKTTFIMIALVLFGSAALAGDNRGCLGEVDFSMMKTTSNSVEIPIKLKNVKGVKGYTMVLGYEGDIGNVEFEASEFLYDPLVIPPQIDRSNRIILISAAATQRKIAFAAEGTIGNLVLEKKDMYTKIRVVEMLLVDKDKNLDVIIGDADYLKCSAMLIDGGDVRDGNAKAHLENYPNPANPTTVFKILVDTKSPVSLRIYDANGGLVRNLLNETAVTGEYTVLWDGKDNDGRAVRSGVYFCRLDAGHYSESRKIVVVR